MLDHLLALLPSSHFGYQTLSKMYAVPTFMHAYIPIHRAVSTHSLWALKKIT